MDKILEKNENDLEETKRQMNLSPEEANKEAAHIVDDELKNEYRESRR